MNIPTRSQNHENMFSDFWKVKVWHYQFPVKQNIPMELLGDPAFYIESRNGPADPISPQIEYFPNRSMIFALD